MIEVVKLIEVTVMIMRQSWEFPAEWGRGCSPEAADFRHEPSNQSSLLRWQTQTKQSEVKQSEVK
jgi:hypothetical protein